MHRARLSFRQRLEGIYKNRRPSCGIQLPAGLTESAELPRIDFQRRSTKAEEGHDENISFEEACKIVGTDLATQARDLSLRENLPMAATRLRPPAAEAHRRHEIRVWIV